MTLLASDILVDQLVMNSRGQLYADTAVLSCNQLQTFTAVNISPPRYILNIYILNTGTWICFCVCEFYCYNLYYLKKKNIFPVLIYFLLNTQQFIVKLTRRYLLNTIIIVLKYFFTLRFWFVLEILLF